MADNIFDIEIITPDRVFYKGETDFLEFNTQNQRSGQSSAFQITQQRLM